MIREKVVEVIEEQLVAMLINSLQSETAEYTGVCGQFHLFNKSFISVIEYWVSVINYIYIYL